ncbi:hypothetical protein [Marinibacterium profundimaris]|uniref:Lipoprotein n=1 Tax=Marinibacterium profundimaris TaxID=1679460 RepID=A0A225NXU5_9RHOB|nr:hypothetical protein [Marinibacterium profundimaris]OWU78087.1 hypothetical protein ATO3_04485 [Marinibacterium profundimaris]
MKARKAILCCALVAVTVTGGCSSGFFSSREAVLFDGIDFRRKAKTPDRNDRKSFQVTVRPVSASMSAARRAGKYEGTSYCINNFGNSDIKWQIGPEAEVVPVENDTLTLVGRCNP